MFLNAKEDTKEKGEKKGDKNQWNDDKTHEQT